MIPDHRKGTQDRIDQVFRLLKFGPGRRVRIERPVFMLVRYYLDGEYVITRGIYQLLSEELPEAGDVWAGRGL